MAKTNRPTSWELGVEKLLVKHALKHPENFKWQVQGLGMLRTYLRDDWRLHIWDKSVRTPEVSPLHEHPWDLHSTIVAGTLYNTRYINTDPNDQFTWDVESKRKVYNGAVIKCGEGACTLTDVKPFSLYEMPRETYFEGDTYTQTKDEIHKSDAEDGTVTLVYRTFYPEREKARVYWETGQFVSAEPRRATEEEVKTITKRALNRWFVEGSR